MEPKEAENVEQQALEEPKKEAQQTEVETPKKETPDFNQLLKDNREYQRAFDRQVQNALNTARSKWEEELEAKLSEAEKLTKMKESERAEYLIKQREEKINAREKELNLRELKATAVIELGKLGLSPDFAEFLDYSNAENCSKSINTLADNLAKEVELQVNKRLRGNPPKTGRTQAASTDEEKYNKAMKDGNLAEAISIKNEHFFNRQK